MRQQNSLFSTIGLALTLIMLGGLGWAIWRSGGMAFSPGRLTSRNMSGNMLGGALSHADIEPKCSRCHAPLKNTQDVLCLGCHTEIAGQIDRGQGSHSLIHPVRQCSACHSDHQGRDFDAVEGALPLFDHAATRFSLTWHQLNYDATGMNCSECHSMGGDFTLAEDSCTKCHANHDAAFMQQHQRDYGKNCLACHDGADRMSRFDHSATGFPLQGQHSATACTACHRPEDAGRGGLAVFSLAQTPTRCEGCHDEPSGHSGMFGTDCADCHTPDGWKPARWQGSPFDHTTQTAFSLDKHAKQADGTPLVCIDCHSGGNASFDVQTCIACHSQGDEQARFMSEHQNKFGTACLDCHDGADRMSHFDHASVFPLDGAHAPLECETCHAGKVFKGTPSQCVQCHEEPAIHAGFFGVQCQNCHVSQAWTPAGLRFHSYPLDHGGQEEIPCQTCHTSTYVEYTCYGCHDHQPEPVRESHIRAKVSIDELPSCTKCHPK